MKLFLIIIVLAFIVFAVCIYLGWVFTRTIEKADERQRQGLYYDDEEDYWF